MHLRIGLVALGLGAMLAACHSHMEDVPLTEQKVYFSDKFYDVKSLSAERALIVGYGGKILHTPDRGAPLTQTPNRPRPPPHQNLAPGNKLRTARPEARCPQCSGRSPDSPTQSAN